MLPLSKTKLQSTRILLVCDSTVRANLHLPYLLQVSLITLSLATLDDIEENLKATFQILDAEKGKSETMKCPEVINVANMIDHLATNDRLHRIFAGDQPEEWTEVETEAVAFVVDLNRFADNVEKHFPGVTLLFSAPPATCNGQTVYKYSPEPPLTNCRACIGEKCCCQRQTCL